MGDSLLASTLNRLHVLFSPIEFEALSDRDLSDSAVVVFDVFRATTTMVTALSKGARAILPVKEISDALTARQRNPAILLAGERSGFRIGADLSGGVEFDLGNSPLEFTKERVADRVIAMTTTNGTRCLQACSHAAHIYLGAFPNLAATLAQLLDLPVSRLFLVCAGTRDECALEDALGAGALCDRLSRDLSTDQIADSAAIARRLFQASKADLHETTLLSDNGRRLAQYPSLRDDIPFCLTTDCFPLVAQLESDGFVRAVGADTA